MSWRSKAQTLRWNISPFIDGRYRASASDRPFEHLNPATETMLCQFSVGDPADIDLAVRSGRAAFEDGRWSGRPPAQRVEILLRLADLIVEHSAELALLDCLEMGKPIQAALLDAAGYAPRLVRSWANLADKLLGMSAPISASGVSFNMYQPRGVVGAITPWNFPTPNAAFKFAPALAAGNSVVLKPSELSPSSALRLAELALEAGLPEGILNVVPGLGTSVGAALAAHLDVDLISFTGSTATGRQIMALAGNSNGKPVLLEMGGKSPHIVFDDVDDLDMIADAAAESVLRNQGQVCSAHARVLVNARIKDALVAKILDKLSGCQPGDPLDDNTSFGPLASPAQRERVKMYVEQGIADGAEPVLQGSIQETGGCYVGPTIFDRVLPTMSIAREEIFGPVLCIQSFDSDDDALKLANAPTYGLAATVWTRDMGRSKRFAHAIRAGMVTIRTSGAEDDPSGCMLGVEPQKASGFGSELGINGLQSYSTLKLISFSGA